MPSRTEPADLLERAGLRPTTVRQRVLSTLLEAGRSLSHRELAEQLQELDRITIFRSLKILRKAGILHGVQGIDRTVRYVPTTSAGTVGAGERRSGGATGVAGECPGGHPHFLCLECGAMSCLSDQPMPRIRVPRGAQVRGKQLLIYGTCPACAASKRAEEI